MMKLVRRIGAAFGVAERRENLLRAIGEHGRRLVERHAAGDGARAARRRRSTATASTTNARPGRAPRTDGDRVGFAGGREHVGRRRFAGGQRRGQRIAARQRRGHRERRRRPPLRIALEAAQDDALDRRIEIAHDRRRRRHRAGVVQLLQVAERLRVVGAAPVKISNRIRPSA